MSEMDTAYRDELARQRTQLANERTLLAYARTMMILIVAGATAIKLFGDERWTVISGWILIALGVVVGCIGMTRIAKVYRSLRRIGDGM